MRPMRLMMALVLTAGSALASDTDARPALQALAEADRRLVNNWLALDCGVGDPLVDEMVTAGGTLEASLWEAYELGPDAAARDAAQASLARSWANRRAWIQREGTAVAGHDVAARLAAVGEEDYRATKARRLENRVRDAALRGLGLVCGEESRWRIEQIAADETNPSRVAAREALRRSDGCSRDIGLRR